MGLAVAITAAVTAAAPVSQGVTSYPAASFAAYQPSTAFDMVSRLPGFIFDGGGQVRGFGGAAGNVLVDGSRPAAKDDSLDDILRRIPASSVLRIDVIRGGAPGVDMQGKTILANVVRRAGIGPKLTVNVMGERWYDGRPTYEARAEGSAQLGATMFEGSLLAASGIDPGAGNGARTLIAPSGALIQTASETSRLNAETYKLTAATTTPVWGGKLRAHVSLSSNPYDYIQDDRLIDPPGQDEIEIDRQTQETAEAGLDFDRPLGAKTSLEAVLLQQVGKSQYTDDFSKAGEVEHFALGKKTGESIARITLKHQPWAALTLEAGAEGAFNGLTDHTVYLVDGVPTPVPAADVRVTEVRGEGFATVTWAARRILTLEAGIRLEGSRIASTGDVVSSRTLIYPKPRAVLTWSPDAADQIRLRLEREVGQINFDDFAAGAASLSNGAVKAGNPNLDPAQDWVIEGAYERRFWGGGDVTLTLRHYAITDVVDRIPVYDPIGGDYDEPGNIGAGTKDELVVNLTVPTDRLFVPNGLLTGQAKWRRSSVTDPVTGQARSISGLHPYFGELHFTQGVPSLKASWGFDINQDQLRESVYFFNEIDTEKLKLAGNVFAEYRPRGDLILRAEIDDITGFGVEHIREVYDGIRNAYPLAYTDIRNLHSGPGVYLRLRKTFG